MTWVTQTELGVGKLSDVTDGITLLISYLWVKTKVLHVIKEENQIKMHRAVKQLQTVLITGKIHGFTASNSLGSKSI